MNSRDLEAIYPLTPLQQGMLFRTLYAPGSGTYVEQASYRLRGELDVEALERAWQRAVEGHPVLRTGFFWEGREEPLQAVFRRAPLDLMREDWRGQTEDERRRKLEERLDEDRRRGFDLARPPLMRLLLFRLEDRLWQLVWTHHHIILDGWSVALLLRRVLTFYAGASLAGASHDLAAAPSPALQRGLPFRDYVSYQRQRDLTAAERFWRRSLAGLDEGHGLDLPRGDAASDAPPEETHCDLSPEATARVLDAARAFGVSLATAVQGALALLLGRWSLRREVVFGLTVSGRPQHLEGAAEAVGLFINTLPLPVRLDEDETAGDYLRRLQDFSSEAQEHGFLPLPKVQAWSPVPQEQRLFETLLVVENYPRPESAEYGLDLQIEDFRLFERTDYPLTFVVVPGERLRLTAVHDPGRVSAAVAARMIGHLGRLLPALLGDSGRALGEIEMLSRAERSQLVGAGTLAPSETSTLIRLFCQQAAAAPERAALTDGDRTLTYGQLAEQVSVRARWLVAAGVEAGEIVGVCLERGSELVISLLAVLEAGAAYLPLDPAYPRDRLRFMAADSGTRWVICQGSLADLWASPAAEESGRGSRRISVGVLRLEDGSFGPNGSAAGGPATLLDRSPLDRALPGSPAYVIYTSGSTGQPKGVLVGHRHVVRLFQATEARFDFHARGAGEAQDVWTLFHSYAFDFSVWEIWGALLYGGRLVVVPRETARSAEAFRDLLGREGVTVLNQTPSAFRELIRVDARFQPPAQALALRWVIFGGEALDPGSLRPWLERHPASPRLVNMYGITETTVHVTWREITAGDLGAASVIGEPLEHLAVYILDSAGGLLPAGAAGEICVGGGGVSWGYLNRPALTAQRFAPDPYAVRPGERLYRSGDRARWAGSSSSGFEEPAAGGRGELEYLGRLDQQVKIRGYRIEPGEIAAVLAEHPAVREAVVLAQDSPAAGSRGGGGLRLVAYWIPEAEASSNSRETEPRPWGPRALRDYLLERLPEHMVPAHLMRLERFPLTANGKLDRRALPRPEAEKRLGDLRPPRTPLEQAMAEIWADVLGAPAVGIDENFYELGGHSLVATQLVSRLRRAFQVDLSVRSVLEAPTVLELSEQVQKALARTAEAELPLEPLARDAVVRNAAVREEGVPLSFAQERLWLLDRLSPGDPAFHVQAGLRLDGDLVPEILAAALRRVVERHEALRTVFELRDGEPRQRVVAPWAPPLPVVDLRRLSAQDRRSREAELLTAAVGRPFDLRRGPLLRWLLLRLGEREHALHVTLHHIVSDGWSMGLLVREVVTAYRGGLTEEPAELPPLPVQFPDFAVWQRRSLSGEHLRGELEHWHQVLGGPAPRLELPAARREAAENTFRGAARPVLLSASLAGGLRQLARRCGATLFMTLLAAFQALLWRLTGESDVRVGAPIAGRRRLETEDLIGLFLNTLILRADLSDDPGFRQLLARVRATALDAFAHQEVPYELVMRALEPQGDGAALPVPQVLFLMQNFPLVPIEVPDLTLQPIVPERLAAQAELALELAERGDRIEGLLAYNRDRFTAAAVDRMVQQLITFLEEIVEAPDRPLSELALAAEEPVPAGRFTKELDSW
ncbi:MAG: amino acid adenylation domain-containing protein [Acidobacteriota bacterium]|nr:amino acid adenylation domain-containing protein [Acidobacteriota bacterium]